ncbi:hypothetical protein H2198_002149 [Neophaeococcomyces mojaviensis]|uniref:Uncharacterized protein n=1 Tax=Neophaeococcomyces mojaviensis TaxID=3383035 RepID=A0ACC3AF55_9EURO|nr:hypothetical protein H2198_002149 [Knufia sp. JES_112]
MISKEDHREDLAALQQQYLHALARNKEVKRHYDQLLQQHRTLSSRAAANSTSATHATANPSSGRHRHLTTHLQNLRLQHQYSKLQTIAHYTEQAEQIAESEKLYDALPLAGHAPPTADPATEAENDDASADVKAAQQRVDVLLTGMKALTGTLELALVRARQELKRERELLEIASVRAEQRREDGIESGPEGAMKLRALETTRAELQTWITKCLARCEEPVAGQVNGQGESAAADGQSEAEVGVSEEDVKREYDKYIEARKRLLKIVKILKEPLSSSISASNGTATPSTPARSAQKQHLRPAVDRSRSTPVPHSAQPQRPAHLHHRSRISLTHTHKTVDHVSGPSLSEIETQHLPIYSHEKLLSTHLTHLQDQTHAQDARLLQTLNLLSHESHLLPTYPFMASTVVERNGENPKLEVEQLLRAWAFAATEADDQLEEGVGGMVEEIRLALEGAGARMEDLQMLEGMRREVVGAEGK